MSTVIPPDSPKDKSDAAVPKEKPKGITRQVTGLLSKILPGQKPSASSVETPTKSVKSPPQETSVNSAEMAKSVKKPGVLSRSLSRVGGKLFAKAAAKKEFSGEEKTMAKVKNMLTFLHAQGYETEGVFRVPGYKSKTAELLKKLEKDPEAAIDKSDMGIFDVADAVKLAFKEVAFSPELANELIKLGSETPIDLSKLGNLQLTDKQRTMLDDLFKYGAALAKHADVNKMNSSNIGQLFATIFNPDPKTLAETAKYASDGKTIQGLFKAIIDSHITPGATPVTFSEPQNKPGTQATGG